jgi:hypothetical protein
MRLSNSLRQMAQHHDRYLIGSGLLDAKLLFAGDLSFARVTPALETPMKIVNRLTAAAVVLLAGVSVVAAAGVSKSSTPKPAPTGSASSAMSQPVAADSLSLSVSQQQTAWKDISAQATKESAPPGFTANVGAAVPSDLATHPVPVSTSSKVPELRPYQYALLSSGKLLIINPTDKKIAEVITK